VVALHLAVVEASNLHWKDQRSGLLTLGGGVYVEVMVVVVQLEQIEDVAVCPLRPHVATSICAEVQTVVSQDVRVAHFAFGSSWVSLPSSHQLVHTCEEWC